MNNIGYALFTICARFIKSSQEPASLALDKRGGAPLTCHTLVNYKTEENYYYLGCHNILLMPSKSAVQIICKFYQIFASLTNNFLYFSAGRFV